MSLLQRIASFLAMMKRHVYHCKGDSLKNGKVQYLFSDNSKSAPAEKKSVENSTI
jgi:hypothetical protein